MPNTFCSVDGCGNRKNIKIPFFSLPVDDERRKMWIEIIGRPDLLIRAELNPRCHFVCAVHFEDSMTIKRLLLKQDAIPSKLVPNPPNIGSSRHETGCSNQSTPTNDVLSYHVNVTSVAQKEPFSKSIGTQTGTYVRCSETQTTTWLAEAEDPSRKRKLRESETKRRVLQEALNKIEKEIEFLTSLDSNDDDDDDDLAEAKYNIDADLI